MLPQTDIPAVKKSSFVNPFLIIYLTIALIVGLASIQDDLVIFFLASEDSPIQIFSTIGYFIGFVIAVTLQWKKHISFGLGAAVILLSMGLREMDFHDRFTTMGIMKTRFYISDAVPLTEKIPATIIMLTLSYIIAVFLIKHFRPFLMALKTKDKVALLTLNGIAFAIICKLIDSQPHLLVCIIEEAMELGIPYFFISALFLYRKTDQELRPNAHPPLL